MMELMRCSDCRGFYPGSCTCDPNNKTTFWNRKMWDYRANRIPMGKAMELADADWVAHEANLKAGT